MNCFFYKFAVIKKGIGGLLMLLALSVCLASSESSATKEKEEPLSVEAFIKSAHSILMKNFETINLQMKSSVTLLKGGVEVGLFDMAVNFKVESLSKIKISGKGILKYEGIFFFKEDKAFEKRGVDDKWRPMPEEGPCDPKLEAWAGAAFSPLEYLDYADTEHKAEFNFAGQEKIGQSLCKKVRIVTEPGEAERSLNEPMLAFGLKDVDWSTVKFEGIYWIEEKTKRFLKISATMNFLGNGGKIKYTIKVNMDFSHYGEDFDIKVPQEVKDLLKKE